MYNNNQETAHLEIASVMFFKYVKNETYFITIRRMKNFKKNQNLLVTDTCRFALPSEITSSTSSGLETNRSVAP